MSSLFGREAISPRGRWLSITAATVVMQFSYWLSIQARILTDEDGETQFGLLALALAIAPVAFIVQAFGSRHPKAPGAVLRAMGLMLVLGPLFALVNVVVGLVAAFSAGGAVTLRPPADVRARRGRMMAVVVATVYVWLLSVVLRNDFVLLSGAVVPFAAIGVADEIAEGRAREARSRVE